MNEEPNGMSQMIREVVREAFKEEFAPIAAETEEELWNYLEEFPRIPTLKFLCTRGVIGSNIQRVDEHYRRRFYRFFFHDELLH